MNKPVIVIVAYSWKTRAIGKGGKLPWTLPEDMKHFRQVTTFTEDDSKRNAVVMGRKTLESLPGPLPDRLNVVISRGTGYGDKTYPDLLQALRELDQDESIESIFIIGGAEIYAEAFRLRVVTAVCATVVRKEFEGCDTFFPELPVDTFDYVPEERSCPNCDPQKRDYIPTHTVWYDRRYDEDQYLDLVREILDKGVVRGDRTGTGTKSLFGRTMRFSLRNGVLPLLTTKKTFWRGVLAELLWFMSGNTSAKTLQDQNVHIWDGNSTRAYLDSIGLSHREEGDLGPVYGFQWRHFGAEYKTMHDDYTGQGVDQLADLVKQLKTNPDSRRHILSAWNPVAIPEMALPPCHVLAQFYVANGELSCQMYQRSADMGLGVPFNIASYALLTHILAKCCGLRPGEFIHVIGDCHVYLTHEAALKEQLERDPRPFPTLAIHTNNTDIDGFKLEDFVLEGYYPHPAISMEMAV